MTETSYNLYFDNAATTWPKPEPVYSAAEEYLRLVGGSPGRSSHYRAMEAGRLLLEVRERIADLMGIPLPERIAFAFNATDALNMAIKGLVSPGDHVVCTAMEHNSVLRPLGSLKKEGWISVTQIPCSPEGFPDLDYLEESLTPKTSLLVCSHASNLVGTILPVKEMAELAHHNNSLVLVDAAQTAGTVPINVDEINIDLLAFTGHKGLFGPPGTGGLYVREGVEVKPWREGGTGSQSEKDEQPENMPERLEAGTMNTPGLAALNEGIKFVQSQGINNIRNHEQELISRLDAGLRSISGIKVYGPTSPSLKTAVTSFVLENIDSGELGFALEEGFGILSRTGLHCAPLAHRALGTFPQGTLRVSPGYFQTNSDVDYFIACLQEMSSL